MIKDNEPTPKIVKYSGLSPERINKIKDGYIVIGYKNIVDERTGIILKLDKDGQQLF